MFDLILVEGARRTRIDRDRLPDVARLMAAKIFWSEAGYELRDGRGRVVAFVEPIANVAA